jgi:hypothetical protein
LLARLAGAAALPFARRRRLSKRAFRVAGKRRLGASKRWLACISEQRRSPKGRIFVRLVFLMGAALGLTAAPAAADSYRASGARLEYVAADVAVIPEDRADVDVSIAATSRLPAPTVRVDGNRVVIDGGLRNRLQGCTSTLGGGERVRIRGIGAVGRADLPRITLRVPRTLDLSIGGAAFTNIGASGGGSVAHNGCGSTDIADVSGALDVALNGSGDVEVTRVAGALHAELNGSGSLGVTRADADAELRLNGSGDLRTGDVRGDVDGLLAGSGNLRVGNARNALLRLNGSGDVQIGDVAGTLDARLGGSGGIRMGSAGQGARIALNGSGDVDAGDVRGALRADLSGSGSIDIASVQGPSAELSQSSSGDLSVRGGRVERLVARNSGSGNVRFGGVAGTSSIEVRSSGDVTVSDAGRIEQIIDTGSGGAHLGN